MKFQFQTTHTNHAPHTHTRTQQTTQPASRLLHAQPALLLFFDIACHFHAWTWSIRPSCLPSSCLNVSLFFINFVVDFLAEKSAPFFCSCLRPNATLPVLCTMNCVALSLHCDTHSKRPLDACSHTDNIAFYTPHHHFLTTTPLLLVNAARMHLHCPHSLSRNSVLSVGTSLCARREIPEGFQ